MLIKIKTLNRDFTPATWLPPNAITPKKVKQHYRAAQGRPGGTGSVSPPSYPGHLISYSNKMNFTEPNYHPFKKRIGKCQKISQKHFYPHVRSPSTDWREHGRIKPLRGGRAGARASQLIQVPVRSEAEAYHAHRYKAR